MQKVSENETVEEIVNETKFTIDLKLRHMFTRSICYK